MAKKRSFDTAILKDIKSVAGDSFADNIKMLPLEQLHDNPENFYDLSDLDTLVEDIDRQGLKTPLYVVPDDDNGYTVISGHRRKAAVQQLINNGKYGTDKLPCYCHLCTDLPIEAAVGFALIPKGLFTVM